MHVRGVGLGVCCKEAPLGLQSLARELLWILKLVSVLACWCVCACMFGVCVCVCVCVFMRVFYPKTPASRIGSQE
jgi:hypothetical protein